MEADGSVRTGSIPSVGKSQGWICIFISADREAFEAAGAFLMDLGCNGLVEEKTGIAGYLPEPCRREDLLIRLKAFTDRLDLFFPSAHPASASISSVADENWAENWRAFFRPEQISPRLLVVPAWMTSVPHNSQSVIVMDPGPAFGTGKHQTTKLCLREIERLSEKFSGASLLDVGTGSGILAVYAAMLGFKPVTGIDIDPEALTWAERNIELNGLGKKIILSDIRVEAMDRKSMVVLANLILSDIVHLMPHLLARTEDRGRLVISGILKDQIPAVESALPLGSTRLLHVHAEDEWACLTVGVTRTEGCQ